MGNRTWKIVAVALSPLLSACTANDTRQAENAFQGMMEFFLVLMLIAVVMVVVWALILAGGVAAILAGLRRLSRSKEAVSQQASALPPDRALPQPEAANPELPPPDAPAPSEQRRMPDAYTIGLLVFGGVLVVAAAPFVFGAGGGIDLEAPLGGIGITVPLPLLIVAVVLVVFALRRKRR